MELSIINETHPIFKALIEIQKPRTKFQLQKFVVGQHDTEVQQYKQTLLEFASLITGIKITELEIKKSEVQIKRLLRTGDEIDAIDADIQKIHLDQQRLSLLGMKRELEDIVTIWESFETKYTYEDIEDDQPIYWNARLNRQAHLEAMGSGGHVGWASLDALRQIGVKFIEEEPTQTPEVTDP
jgi:hypothetical protein